jgi:hypothetical protein
MVPPTDGRQIALAGATTLVVRHRVVQIAADGWAAAANIRASALANLD